MKHETNKWLYTFTLPFDFVIDYVDIILLHFKEVSHNKKLSMKFL